MHPVIGIIWEICEGVNGFCTSKKYEYFGPKIRSLRTDCTDGPKKNNFRISISCSLKNSSFHSLGLLSGLVLLLLSLNLERFAILCLLSFRIGLTCFWCIASTIKIKPTQSAGSWRTWKRTEGLRLPEGHPLGGLESSIQTWSPMYEVNLAKTWRPHSWTS